MSTYSGQNLPNPSAPEGALHLNPLHAFLLPEGGTVTEYQYRILATGVGGSTTDPGSIPAGSVVVGIVTS